jgi:hypothetical protein
MNDIQFSRFNGYALPTLSPSTQPLMSALETTAIHIRVL